MKKLTWFLVALVLAGAAGYAGVAVSHARKEQARKMKLHLEQAQERARRSFDQLP